MYRLLHVKSQGVTSQVDFVALYSSTTNKLTLLPHGVSYAFSNAIQQGTQVQISYGATFKTQIFGTFDDPDRVISLDSTTDGWRVIWSPGDIFAEMGSGATLETDTVTPNRGNIYGPGLRGHASFQVAQRRACPILPLAVRGELHPAGVSMDGAGQGEIRAHVVSEGVRRIRTGPRRRTGEHKDQVARADGCCHAAFASRGSIACPARRTGIRAREKLMPAARSANAAVPMYLQCRGWAAVAHRRSRSHLKGPSQKGRS